MKKVKDRDSDDEIEFEIVKDPELKKPTQKDVEAEQLANTPAIPSSECSPA